MNAIDTSQPPSDCHVIGEPVDRAVDAHLPILVRHKPLVTPVHGFDGLRNSAKALRNRTSSAFRCAALCYAVDDKTAATDRAAKQTFIDCCTASPTCSRSP